MTVAFSDCGPSLDVTDLEEFEGQIGIKLPSSYRIFLLNYNGGIPDPYTFPIEDFPLNPYGSLQILYSLRSPHSYSDLLLNFKTYQRRLPIRNLPIGNTDSGDVISLTILGGVDGAVMLWDHENESFPPSYDNMYFIARNFDEFLNSIH
jgi:hypothetical protein